MYVYIYSHTQIYLSTRKMALSILPAAGVAGAAPAMFNHRLPCISSYFSVSRRRGFLSADSRLRCCDRLRSHIRLEAVASAAAHTTNSKPPRDGTYTVGDFMTRKENLHVVETTTTVDEALQTLVEKRITGFPVVDADENLVGVVSDYDLLALDSISGGGNQCDTGLFPDVDSSWKTFNEIQKLLGKTDGKVVGDLMTPAPLVVRETSNLEDAVRLLIETKYRRLPVVDANGKLLGLITRGDVVRAALKIKRDIKKRNLSQD